MRERQFQPHSPCHFLRLLFSLSHIASKSPCEFFWIALSSNQFLILQLEWGFLSQISSLTSLVNFQLELACLIKTSSCNTPKDLDLATIFSHLALPPLEKYAVSLLTSYPCLSWHLCPCHFLCFMYSSILRCSFSGILFWFQHSPQVPPSPRSPPPAHKLQGYSYSTLCRVFSRLRRCCV